MKKTTRLLFTIGVVMGLLIQVGINLLAQSQAQPSPPSAKRADQVALIGCVEFEKDYRQRMAAGRGGTLGSGVGANDEFVLTNVRPAAVAVGTSGADTRIGSGGGVYTLTGDDEKNLKRDVGRQVEVMGTLENAGKQSTGADLTDISDLPRIKIESWHTVRDFCPAK